MKILPLMTLISTFSLSIFLSFTSYAEDPYTVGRNVIWSNGWFVEGGEISKILPRGRKGPEYLVKVHQSGREITMPLSELSYRVAAYGPHGWVSPGIWVNTTSPGKKYTGRVNEVYSNGCVILDVDGGPRQIWSFNYEFSHRTANPADCQAVLTTR